jgi:endo-1,3-1,4-beta-glycanase ExoK
MIRLTLIFFLFAAMSGQTFQDNFASRELNHDAWSTATYGSPDSKPGINNGRYVPEAIDLSQGMLRIGVTQKQASNAVDSFGGAIISKQTFHYGTFTFEMRMSSTADTPDGSGEALTGAVSSAFLYNTGSETEIDLEFLGDKNAMYVTTWHGLQSKQSDRISNPNLARGFHEYNLVWSADSVKVYIDGALACDQNHDIPQAPARIILQHRGTNSPKWGGVASHPPRYAYFKYVSYTPEAK